MNKTTQGNKPIDYSTLISARELLGDVVVDTIQGTAPLLAQHGETITGLFYLKMFEAHPQLKHIFNMSNQHSGTQKHALAGAVYRFANQLDDLQGFKTEINRIGQKHASLNIDPAHYPIVGKFLLQAIHEVVTNLLDEQTADTVVDAWGQAYEIFAQLLKDKEAFLYNTTEQQTGGWRGTRQFVLADRQQESSDVVSFYFRAVSGEHIVSYQAGQYISLSVQPDTSDYAQIRQYSLSDEWLDGQQHYRISVKKESGHQSKPAGIVSNFLHDKLCIGDTIALSAPRGEFILDSKRDVPVVLLSGGIGITPMFSMLKNLLSSGFVKPLAFIHGTQNSEKHVFKQELKQLAQDADVDNLIFYSEPLPHDIVDEDYHFKGFIDLNQIKEKINHHNTKYYLCGPVAFMKKMNNQLLYWGVNTSNIHYELFGPRRSLITNE